MAAVSPLFCVSSPESSPVKLEGPGFVVYRVCKRIRDTGDLICPLRSAASVPLIRIPISRDSTSTYDDDDAPGLPPKFNVDVVQAQDFLEVVGGGELSHVS